jgi:hypothetical protein
MAQAHTMIGVGLVPGQGTGQTLATLAVAWVTRDVIAIDKLFLKGDSHG